MFKFDSRVSTDIPGKGNGDSLKSRSWALLLGLYGHSLYTAPEIHRKPLGPVEILPPPLPLCDIPSGCCSFTGPWTVTRSSLRMLRRVAAFCRPLRPVLLLVSFPRSWSPVFGVLGLCWMWQDVPFARQRRPIIGVLRMCWLLRGSFDCFCCPHISVHRPSIACLAVFLCGPGALPPPPPNRTPQYLPLVCGKFHGTPWISCRNFWGQFET